MNRFSVSVLPVILLSLACQRNPFFAEFRTPFHTPPFDEIKSEHFLPAFREGIKIQQKEIQAIVDDVQSPTFENTLEALEKSGLLLERVQAVFDNLHSANTNDDLQKIAEEVTPLLSAHSDNILLNVALFRRIKTVYEGKASLNLTAEQNRLLEEYYKDFVRGGANLDEEKKKDLRAINEELAMLSLQFGDHVLKEDNAFELVIEKEADLAGLPESVILGAAEAAAERGQKGKWVFTLHKPSLIPFLQYSAQRESREKMFKAYINRGNNDNDLDNKSILSRIAALRVKRANLLGYPTHADFVLDKNMAKKPANVYGLLNQLWKPAIAMAKREADALQGLIDQEGATFRLEPWDWWYYAEKLKKRQYDLDDEVLRPYFSLDNVRNGAFRVATELWGITFEERADIPKYHDDVKVFEVKEADGTHVGILTTDYFPRASKRGGAWMNAFRKQYRMDGKDITPVIGNVFNFSKPTNDRPSLLTLEEVKTLYHEFGHALHGLLSDCTYRKLSGTDVAWDFVELPSQIMENWASEPEVLKMYARHYLTGDPIPDELIAKIQAAGKFNQGFETVEYLAASFLDMDWHTMSEPKEMDAIEFENRSMNTIGLIPEIVVRYRSPYFRHIFSGGYASGYYVYIWAEVLDADAFQAFKENGLFDRKTAMSFRDNILAKGGTEDPMILYTRFRGAEPQIDALLDRRGLK